MSTPTAPSEPQPVSSASINASARTQISYGTGSPHSSHAAASTRGSSLKGTSTAPTSGKYVAQKLKQVLLSGLRAKGRNRTTRVVKTINSQPVEWISVNLRYPFLLFLILITVVFIAAIIILTVLSYMNSGFASVLTPSGRLANFIWGRGLLWTALPAILFSIYRIPFDMVVSASADRQPFVELHGVGRPAASAEVSILLDYRSVSPFKSWFVAFRNKHYLLGTCFIFSLILQLGVTPLSSYLLTTGSIISNTSVVVTQNTFFDTEEGFTAKTDLRPILDAVAATRIDGGNPPAWTDLDEAFQSFSIPEFSPDTTSLTNFSVETTAFSASLDCSILDPSQYDRRLRQDGSESGTLFFSAMDRGCPLNLSMTITAGYQYYLQTRSDVSCDATANLSRLVFLGAELLSGSFGWPSNFSAISCIPVYTSRRGTLEVTLGITQNPVIRSFTPDMATGESKRPGFWHVFETVLSEVYTYDPTAGTSYTEMGRLVVNLAQVRNPENFLDSLVLETAAQQIFSSIWATLSVSNLFRASANASSVTGILSKSNTRLLVVPQVAYTIIAILCAIVLILIWVMYHVRKYPSILFEEPIGIVAQAGLLCDSDLYRDAVRLRSTVPNYNGRMRETMQNEGLFRDAQYGFINRDTPHTARITTEYGRQFRMELSSRA
jgi:hypothetical protein